MIKANNQLIKIGQETPVLTTWKAAKLAAGPPIDLNNRGVWTIKPLLTQISINSGNLITMEFYVNSANLIATEFRTSTL